MSKIIHINCVSKPKLMWSTIVFIHISDESTLSSVFGVSYVWIEGYQRFSKTVNSHQNQSNVVNTYTVSSKVPQTHINP